MPVVFKIILLMFSILLIVQHLYQSKRIKIRTKRFKSYIVLQCVLVVLILFITYDSEYTILNFLVSFFWIIVSILPMNATGLTENGLYHPHQKSYGHLFLSKEVPFEHTRDWEIYEKKTMLKCLVTVGEGTGMGIEFYLDKKDQQAVIELVEKHHHYVHVL